MGISRTRPSDVAAMKFSRNSGPIVGMIGEVRHRVLLEVDGAGDEQRDRRDGPRDAERHESAPINRHRRSCRYRRCGGGKLREPPALLASVSWDLLESCRCRRPSYDASS